MSRLDYCKVLAITFKALHSLGLECPKDYLLPFKEALLLRSSEEAHLHVLQFSVDHLLETRRAFFVAVPQLWHSLPIEPRTEHFLLAFLQARKTFLFPSTFSLL